jgi:hypothetical protein
MIDEHPKDFEQLSIDSERDAAAAVASGTR